MEFLLDWQPSLDHVPLLTRGQLLSLEVGSNNLTPNLSQVVAAGVCKLTSRMLIHPRLRIDDPVDASPVHAFCGMWGVFACSLFARREYIANAYGITDPNMFIDGLFWGGWQRLIAHIIAIICVATWSMAWTFLSFGLLIYLDRNRGKDAYFLEKSAKVQRLEFGRAEKPRSTTGFINPDLSNIDMTTWNQVTKSKY